MSPFASKAALEAHKRMAALPRRQHCLLGIDREMQQRGIAFRPTSEPSLRERVMHALLLVGGRATISALAQTTGMPRVRVRQAVEGMMERGLMERALSVRRAGATGGREGVFRVVGWMDE